MRYLWDTPHSLSGDLLQQLLPDFQATPLEQALPHCLPKALLAPQAGRGLREAAA
jgi:hypothetical protein